MTRFVVVAGGPSTEPVRFRPTPDATIVVADSGADRAHRAGWPVHHVVGDLDSVSPAGLAHARAQGAQVHRHPEDKDATDLELALGLAIDRGATEIDVVLDPAGRFDHLLVAAHVLAAEAYASAVLRAVVGRTRLQVVRGSATIEGTVGDLVTIVPIGGPARVTTTDLSFALSGEWLQPASGRGLSNRLAAASAEVDVLDGVVLVIQPG